MDKSKGKLGPAWTTGTTGTNWNLPLSVNNCSPDPGLPCRKRCPLPRSNAGAWPRIWRTWKRSYKSCGSRCCPSVCQVSQQIGDSVSNATAPAPAFRAQTWRSLHVHKFSMWPFLSQNQTEKKRLNKVIAAWLSWHSTKPPCVFAETFTGLKVCGWQESSINSYNSKQHWGVCFTHSRYSINMLRVDETISILVLVCSLAQVSQTQLCSL